MSAESTDSAALRLPNKLKKGLSRRAPSLGLGSVERLTNIQPTFKEKLESASQLAAFFDAEPRAPKPDYIQAKDEIAFRGETEWRNIFAERRQTLGDRESSNANELVEDTTATKKNAILDSDVAAKQAMIGDNDLATDGAVMTEMRAGHKEIVITDFGGRPFGGSAMNGYVFANDVSISDFYPGAGPGFETQILG